MDKFEKALEIMSVVAIVLFTILTESTFSTTIIRSALLLIILLYSMDTFFAVSKYIGNKSEPSIIQFLTTIVPISAPRAFP